MWAGQEVKKLTAGNLETKTKQGILKFFQREGAKTLMQMYREVLEKKIKL